MQDRFELNSSCNGWLISARRLENFPSWFIIPINLHKSDTFSGFGIPTIAAVLSGSAWMPFLSMRCPKNFMLIRLNSHFSGFRITPADWIHFSIAANRESCSSLLAPKMRTSSIWHRIPSSPSKIALMRLWKSSGTLEMQKGSLLKRYRPNGVMNVVNKQDSSTESAKIHCSHLICETLLLLLVVRVFHQLLELGVLLWARFHLRALDQRISGLIRISSGPPPFLHTKVWDH